MEGIIVILVLIALVVGGWVMYTRARSSPEGQRVETYLRSERGKPSNAPPPAREPTVETLRPGDAISFWDGEDTLVDCVLECEENLGARRTRWRWNLLRGGRMLETAPDDNVLYTKSEVAHQGTALFETLAGDPATGGVLKTFEARVRAGTVGSNPMYFTYDGQQFQIRSTGTFGARPLGPPPTAEVWRDLADDPSQNVYFEMDAPDGTQGLGIWTTHILLLTGDKLKTTDINSIYPGQATAD
jgi:hypothetical protein